MKISKRKLGILFIFLAFIFIETISFATYQTTVLGEKENNNKMKYEIEMEQEEVVLSQEEQETLDLINEYREQNGLTKLKPIANLQKVAKLKAEDLVNNNYFYNVNILSIAISILMFLLIIATIYLKKTQDYMRQII